MKAKAMAAARSIASREPSPIVGEMIPNLSVSILKGRAPELIWSASFLAESLSKLPVIIALPSVIGLLTEGAEIRLPSIQIEMGVLEPASSEVASANFCLPEELSLRVTTHSKSPLLSGC